LRLAQYEEHGGLRPFQPTSTEPHCLRFRIDTLLQVRESAPSGRSEGLFPDYTPDLAPAEISALMTFVSELRAKMADKLTAYGFGSTAAKTTAKHAAHSH
jgi:hypothetical protein